MEWDFQYIGPVMEWDFQFIVAVIAVVSVMFDQSLDQKLDPNLDQTVASREKTL